MALKAIEVSVKAPDFTLTSHADREVSLSGLSGRRVLLSFHPLAWTTVCEVQMRSLEIKKPVFDRMNAVALGISVDAPASKKAWARHMELTATDLLCDFWPHGGMAGSYGLFLKEKGISARANVVVGPDGTVEWVRVYELLEIPDIEEVIRCMKQKTG